MGTRIASSVADGAHWQTLALQQHSAISGGDWRKPPRTTHFDCVVSAKLTSTSNRYSMLIPRFLKKVLDSRGANRYIAGMHN
jgi:hypothetical protein